MTYFLTHRLAQRLADLLKVGRLADPVHDIEGGLIHGINERLADPYIVKRLADSWYDRQNG